jgi:hypothetical protein
MDALDLDCIKGPYSSRSQLLKGSRMSVEYRSVGQKVSRSKGLAPVSNGLPVLVTVSTCRAGFFLYGCIWIRLHLIISWGGLLLIVLFLDYVSIICCLKTLILVTRTEFV